MSASSEYNVGGGGSGGGGASAIAVIDAGAPGHGGGEHSHVAHQFDDLAQQKEAVTLGMWAFLATEIMFFGGAFLAYSLYRFSYPEAFNRASDLESWPVGLFNTGVLLFSSLFVVLAVHAAHHGDRRGIILWLAMTIVAAFVFFGVKAYEYHHLWEERLIPGARFDEYRPGHTQHFAPPPGATPEQVIHADQIKRGAQIFFSFYFAATGLHALHMVIGVGVIAYVIWMAYRGRFTREYYNPVEITGLYWHFVDIVWIFLYPLLYLVDRAG